MIRYLYIEASMKPKYEPHDPNEPIVFTIGGESYDIGTVEGVLGEDDTPQYEEPTTTQPEDLTQE